MFNIFIAVIQYVQYVRGVRSLSFLLQESLILVFLGHANSQTCDKNDFTRLQVLPDFDRITVLTGADEEAVAAHAPSLTRQVASILSGAAKSEAMARAKAKAPRAYIGNSH